MASAMHNELVDIARARRVHFDVEPEVMIRGSERASRSASRFTGGRCIRRAPEPLPGCTKCFTDHQNPTENSVPD